MTTLDRETFTRALEIVGHRKLCRHEAGHATAAVLLGLDVKSVRAGHYTLDELEHSDLNEAAGEAVFYSPHEHSREAAIATLCGPLCEPCPDWPPTYVVALHAPGTPDEKDVGAYIRAADLDRDAYDALCAEARALTETPTFKRLHALMVDRLATPPHTIGRAEIRHLQKESMEHKTIGATTVEADDTTTDLGTFTAIVSAWEADREGDTIAPTAFDRTIAAWRASGKSIPLLFEHSTEAIGSIDPATMHPTEAGLVVSGEVDRSSQHGAQVWAQIKAGSAGFSIGFMGTSTPRTDARKGRAISEIDLLEISATSTPMHPAARVLDWKSASSDPDHDPAFDSVRHEWSSLVKSHMGAPSTTTTKHVESQRERAEAIARELAPIQTASFEC